MRDNPIEVDTTSFRLPFKHIFHLIGLHGILLVFIFISRLAMPEYKWPFITLILLSPAFSIWQTNIISPKADRRIYHFQTRLVGSILLPAIVTISKMIEGARNQEWVDFFTISLIYLIYSGIFSFIIYNLKIKLLTQFRFYIISKSVWVLPILCVLVTIPYLLNHGWFNSNYEDFKVYNELDELDFDDFKGNPNYFSKYDASINSWLEFVFDDDEQLISIDATCYTGKTWVKPWSDDSRSLLRHERYHFKITEMVARMARKQARQALDSGVTKYELLEIRFNYLDTLSRYQSLYDEESNHGLIIDKQARWQHKIDSILFSLDPYWASHILKPRDSANIEVKYFRKAVLNIHGQYLPILELMPGEEDYTSHYKFVYNESSELVEIEYYKHGKPNRDPLYDSPLIKVNRGDNYLEYSFFDKKRNPKETSGKYHKLKIIKEKNCISSQFFNKKNERVVSKLGIYEAKRLIKKDFISEIFFDSKQRRIPIYKGVFERKYWCDNTFNLPDSIAFFGLNGEKASNGFHKRKNLYNSSGLIMSKEITGLDGSTAYIDGATSVRYKRDELGYITEICFLDLAGNLIEDKDGIARKTYSTDRYGGVNRYYTYNSNNVLINIDGISKRFRKYDSLQRIVYLANYDSGGRLVLDDDGNGILSYTYNQEGLMSSKSITDAYGYLLNRNKTGAISFFEYDTNQFISRTYYETWQGVPDTTNLGEASECYKYDKEGNLIEIKIYDLDGNLFESRANTAIYRYNYDDRGNKIKAMYFNAQDKPAFANQGIHINDYVYNEFDQMIERSYRDTANQLANFDGFAKIKWSYDTLGNIIQTSYYDSDNKLVNDGVAVNQNIYDEAGNQIEEKQFNYLNKLGLHIIKDYDENGNLTRKSFFGKNGKAITDEFGVHIYTFDFENDKIVKKRNFDINGELIELDGVAVKLMSYDERENLTTITKYDKNLNLVNDSSNSFSIIKYTYDLYDRKISETYYKSENKLALKDEKYSQIKFKRDNSGNIIYQAFFDSTGELSSNRKDIALISYTYNLNNYMKHSDVFLIDEAVDIVNKIDW